MDIQMNEVIIHVYTRLLPKSPTLWPS